MASFFRGATQSTPFQQAIEKVTDGNQLEEDWGTIMKICDHVAVQDERFPHAPRVCSRHDLRFFSAKEAMKVIRKRLQFTAPSTEWRSVSLTLTVSGLLSSKGAPVETPCSLCFVAPGGAGEELRKGLSRATGAEGFPQGTAGPHWAEEQPTAGHSRQSARHDPGS